MSIPFFFEPGRLNQSVIVDGAILSNFPLWIFDRRDEVQPRWPTFGFQLTDQNVAPEITGPVDILKGMFQTMMYASDRRYVQLNNFNRIIGINLTGVDVSATKFGLTDRDKDELYRRGYENTRDFFLNTWNWKEHLRLRGFSQE